MNKLASLTLAAVIVLAGGCRTKQQLTTTDGPHTPNVTNTDQHHNEQRLNAIAASQLAWNTMQSGGNVKIGGSKSFSSAMQMRMIRNHAIYISLRPMLGIEVGKIVITSDSLLVVDKYHKRYIAEPISLITNGIPVTVSAMQDIFLGRAFLLGTGSVNSNNKEQASLTTDGLNYRLSPKAQPQEFTYNFTYNDKNHILAVEVIPSKGKQTPYRATYSEVKYEPMVGNIAHHAEVSASVSGSSFTLSLDLKNVTWNGNVTIDSTRPDKYKRIDGKQITTILDGQ